MIDDQLVRQQQVDVSYYSAGQTIGHTLTTAYPHYHRGDAITLPTSNDQRSFIVERVHHTIEEWENTAGITNTRLTVRIFLTEP